MSDPNPPDRGFEHRLASMERRLAEIQDELAPEQPQAAAPLESPEPREAAAPLAPPEPVEGAAPLDPPEVPEVPEAAGGAAPVATPRRTSASAPIRGAADPELLGGLYVNLLTSARRLVDGYEAALREIGGQAPPSAEATVSAGPFQSTSSLREFERELAALPGVRDVAIRGYQAGDRAILEVQLEPETT